VQEKFAELSLGGHGPKADLAVLSTSWIVDRGTRTQPHRLPAREY